MVKVDSIIVHKKTRDNTLYINKILKGNLDLMKEKIKKDFDFVGVVDGPEGSGKSVCAQQVGKYLDPSLNLDRITFNPKEFKKAIMAAEKYQCVIFDEAYAGLSSRQAMSLTNKTVVSMLAEIRQKNLFVIIVLPTFFDLDRNVAIWRSRFLIHVYLDKEFNRGQFLFYNAAQKKALYVCGKKYYSYGKIKCNFLGDFKAGYVVNEQEYRSKKLKALERHVKEETMGEELRQFKRELVTRLYENRNMMKLSQQDIATFMGITENTMRRYRRQLEKDNEEGKKEIETHMEDSESG